VKPEVEAAIRRGDFTVKGEKRTGINIGLDVEGKYVNKDGEQKKFSGLIKPLRVLNPGWIRSRLGGFGRVPGNHLESDEAWYNLRTELFGEAALQPIPIEHQEWPGSDKNVAAYGKLHPGHTDHSKEAQESGGRLNSDPSKWSRHDKIIVASDSVEEDWLGNMDLKIGPEGQYKLVADKDGNSYAFNGDHDILFQNYRKRFVFFGEAKVLADPTRFEKHGLSTPTARAQLLRTIVNDKDFDDDTRTAVYEAMRAKAGQVKDLVEKNPKKVEDVFRPLLEARYGTSARGQKKIERIFAIMKQKGARAVDDVETLISQTENDRLEQLKPGAEPFKGDEKMAKGQATTDSSKKAFLNRTAQRFTALRAGIRLPKDEDIKEFNEAHKGGAAAEGDGAK
jgi:hypothetical protein